MTFSFSSKITYVLLSLGVGLLFIYGGNTSYARTVPVKEIIKIASDSAGPQILLDEKTVDALTIPSPISTIGIAKTPLFMEQQSLKPQVRDIIQTKIDPQNIYAWTLAHIQDTATEPEDAKMVTQNNRVVDFSPGKNGLTPDIRKTTIALLNNLVEKNSVVSIAGIIRKPQNTLTDTNTLGINELLSGGISDFSNSSKNRLANIEAGMQQVKGVIIKPGETFSFGEYLGDVTAAKGFKPEIVIKAEGLVPELGGGICQVSSTLFRAVMQSGMQITQRRNHAFSVSHYFPPGTDATIYTPATDLKFINDTPAHVLIWPYYIDKTHLAFDLYGTRDSRSVIVDEPIQWDKKSDGSMKASWTRHVTNNGVTRDDTLKSTYLPPALFKKEEKFVVATPTAVAPPNTAIPPENPPSPTN